MGKNIPRKKQQKGWREERIDKIKRIVKGSPSIPSSSFISFTTLSKLHVPFVCIPRYLYQGQDFPIPPLLREDYSKI